MSTTTAQQVYDTMQARRISPGNYRIEDTETGQVWAISELSEYTGRTEWGITINEDPCEVTTTLEHAKVMAARTIAYCKNLKAHGMVYRTGNGGLPYYASVPFTQSDTIETTRYIYG